MGNRTYLCMGYNVQHQYRRVALGTNNHAHTTNSTNVHPLPVTPSPLANQRPLG